MTALNARQLELMRRQVLSTLPATAIIQGTVWVSDGAGGGSTTYAAVEGGTVACRLDPLSQAQIEMTFGKAEVFAEYFQLTLPYDAPLEAHHRLLIDGLTYEVRTLSARHSWNVAVRARVSRVT